MLSGFNIVHGGLLGGDSCDPEEKRSSAVRGCGRTIESDQAIRKQGSKRIGEDGACKP